MSQNKSVVSANLSDELIDALDDNFENRSQGLELAARKLLLDDELYEKQIEDLKAERDEWKDQKREAEDRIDEINDQIRELADKKTEVKTMAKVRDQIPEKEIDHIKETINQWKSEWRKGDPRAPTKTEIIEKKSVRIIEKDEIGLTEAHETKVKQYLKRRFGC